MFLEDEEWNDEPDAQALSNTVLSVKSDNITNIKSRGIRGVRKKKLMRTLQALGTVPDWKSDAPQDGSDSEGETVSLPSEKKKKRRRRRKSDLSGEEEGKNDLDSKKSKKNKSGSSEANTDEVTGDSKEIESAVKTEEQNTDKLSRKHWKNKMKNKKKCKNKYRPNDPKQESIKAAIPGQHNPEEQQKMNSGSNSNEKTCSETPAQPKKTHCKPQKRKNLEKALPSTKTPREDKQVISVEKLKKGINAKKSSVQDSNHEAGERQGGIEDEQQASPSKRLKLESSKKQVLKKQKLQQKVISGSNSNEKTLSETPAQQKKTQNKPQKKKNIEKALPSTKTPREDKQVMISLKQGIDAQKSLVQESNHEAGQGGIEDEQQASPSKKIKLELSNEQVLKRQKLKRLLQGHGPDKEENPTEQKDEKEPEATQAKADVKEAPVDHSTSLRARMEQRLEAARFRYINEVLYTTSSGEAKRMFKQDPAAFDVYHRGFTNQVQRWPSNPVDDIIKFIQKKPPSQVVADFGCGDCKIARSVKNKVHSFDLVPICDLVTVCDIAKVPLEDNTVDIAVFCLSLMGTNLHDFLSEANRVLVKGGVLKIAEVASRFDNVRSFLNALASFGFKLVSKDTENTHFYTFDLVKTGDAPANIKKLRLELKPCVYKKR